MRLTLVRRRSTVALAGAAPRGHGGRNELRPVANTLRTLDDWEDPFHPEDRLLRPRHRFVVTETVLHVPGLHPAHDGLRIAQLSDLHIGQATSDVRILRAVNAVNARRPDLVFLTGDYVTHSPRPLPRVHRLLSGRAGRVFVVLGNHDHWVDAPFLRRGFERLGHTVLQNEHRVVRVHGAPATILGIDDERTGHADVERTFDGAPCCGTRLVLTHVPPTVERLPAHANLVQFSGHTHGGQIVVKGLTEAVFRRYGQPYIAGHYHVRGNQLYVNRGLGFGFGGPYLRRGSQPEVSLFTLRRAPAAMATAAA
jgi:uncharacterized protein